MPCLSHLLSPLLWFTERSHCRKGEQHSGSPVQAETFERAVGLRYKRHFPSTRGLSALPSAARIAVEAFLHNRLQKPRGAVREKNDNTMDSRAHAFSLWLEDHDVTPQHISTINSETAQGLLGAYLEEISEGNYLCKATGTPKTL